MDHFGLLLKSYRGDLAQARRLVDSYRRYAPGDIPMTAIVPRDDLPLFRAFTGEDIQLIPEEELGQHLVDHELAGLRPGYVNQEIVKLAFHELGVYEHYFTVDSELEFLRPFRLEDFLAPDRVPYSVLVEDRDLLVDPAYYSSYWTSREQAHRAIWETVGVMDPVIRTCHGHTTLSTPILRSFVSHFLTSRNWTYRDAIAFAPYEYTWYNAWLLKSELLSVHPREPLVKVFHTEQQLLTSLAQGIDRAAISRGYLGMVVNGSFDQGRSLSTSFDDKISALPLYLSTREILALLKRRARVDASERFRWPRR